MPGSNAPGAKHKLFEALLSGEGHGANELGLPVLDSNVSMGSAPAAALKAGRVPNVINPA
jgi:hypothetical protein